MPRAKSLSSMRRLWVDCTVFVPASVCSRCRRGSLCSARMRLAVGSPLASATPGSSPSSAPARKHSRRRLKESWSRARTLAAAEATATVSGCSSSLISASWQNKLAVPLSLLAVHVLTTTPSWRKCRLPSQST